MTSIYKPITNNCKQGNNLWGSHLTRYEIVENNFQQRISWLLQRWRTQRNAIRNANCRIPWVIKSLNAHCASGNPGSMPVWVSVIISHFFPCGRSGLWARVVLGQHLPEVEGASAWWEPCSIRNQWYLYTWLVNRNKRLIRPASIEFPRNSN